ncbi:SSI family serine proteinase inhibitor [Streptomyces sp. NPDC058371]|uniref:SSI family serine proteinase inhibitor n=1 Tax=Streptomyces sp. NPDC058371 TaxID=3346463 RepID=UPI00364BA147
MTRSTHAVRGALLAATALLAVGLVPAQAAPRQTIPDNWLYLTVTTGDTRSNDTRGTLLLCDPPQGHVRAVQACEELRAVQGDISRIPLSADAVCPMIYAPVTVSARGEWSGRRIEYGRTFANSCVMRAETRAVFALAG